MRNTIFIEKNISNFETFFRSKRMNDVCLYNVKRFLVFFNIKKILAILEHVFVNMSNAKKFKNFKKRYFENIHKRFVAIINNDFRIF